MVQISESGTRDLEFKEHSWRARESAHLAKIKFIQGDRPPEGIYIV